MRYKLSERTISIVEREHLSQQELAKQIDKLYREGKVTRTYSQQSISRYLNRISFPNEDTEDIIVTAIRAILGDRKFRFSKKKYQIELEKKEKEIEKRKKAERKTQINPLLNLGMREAYERYKDYLMTDEEIEYYETQKENGEKKEIIYFWRNVPTEIQKFWLEMLDIFGCFSPYMKAIIFSMIGIKQQKLLEVANVFLIQYGIDCNYDKYSNDFTDDELKTIGKLFYGASLSKKKLYEFVQEESYLYDVLFNDIFNWDECEHDVEQFPNNKEEQQFLELYDLSRMNYEEFLYFASLLVCFEKVDWLVIHMAFLLEKNQTNEPSKLFDENLSITEAQIELLNTLRAEQLNEEDKDEI